MIRARRDDGTEEQSEIVHQAFNEANDVKDQLSRKAATAIPAGAPPANTGKGGVSGAVAFGVAAFLGASLLWSGLQYANKFNTPEARKRRATLANAKVVTTLAGVLPENRGELTKTLLLKLRFDTRFSYPEIFRKFLWYVLRDRQFDEDAVLDLVTLKQVMQLSNDDVAQALRERCIRIEAKYGNLMLQTEGLSEKLLQKKATCRALFSKMLYLVEDERIVKENETANVDVLRNIFGATEDDISDLRIVSLQDVDMDKLDSMASDQPGPR